VHRHVEIERWIGGTLAVEINVTFDPRSNAIEPGYRLENI